LASPRFTRGSGLKRCYLGLMSSQSGTPQECRPVKFTVTRNRNIAIDQPWLRQGRFPAERVEAA
jgi:hypothetical protein